MQIFVIDKDYRLCADYLDVKRSNKMLIESVQMLCTAINLNGGNAPYKSTHVNHPCNVWTRKTFDNFMWLWNYANCLSDRYTRRTGKVHKSGTYLPILLTLGRSCVPEGPQTPFPNCTSNFKHIDDVHLAYKLQLAEKWQTDKRKPIFD